MPAAVWEATAALLEELAAWARAQITEDLTRARAEAAPAERVPLRYREGPRQGQRQRTPEWPEEQWPTQEPTCRHCNRPAEDQGVCRYHFTREQRR